jgi:hypothetical protein
MTAGERKETRQGRGFAELCVSVVCASSPGGFFAFGSRKVSPRALSPHLPRAVSSVGVAGR